MIHNIFIDHLVNADGHHHHHGPGDNDVLWHKHDGGDHNHDVDFINDDDTNDYDHDHVLYGSSVHDHPPADDSADYIVIDFVPDDNPDTVESDNDPFHNLPDDDWANNIDNLTGGDPYHHLPE